jgi:hypothetical protein
MVVSHDRRLARQCGDWKTGLIMSFVAADSVAMPADFPVPLQVVSLGPLLAEATRRLSQEHSLNELIAHG